MLNFKEAFQIKVNDTQILYITLIILLIVIIPLTGKNIVKSEFKYYSKDFFAMQGCAIQIVQDNYF